MIDPTAALYAHIITTPEITCKIATYENLPAVFEDRAPDGYEVDEPIIIIDPPHSMTRDDTSTCVGRVIDMRIRVYGRVRDANGATGSEALNDASEILARTLHNSNPDVDTARTCRVAVNGPYRAPTDTPSVGGRVVSIRWNITET